MKKLLIFPIAFLLSGCPGGGVPIAEHRSVFIQGDTICFTVNKTDVLERYSIYYWPKKKYTVIKSDNNISLSYPNTCFNVNLKNGYKYNISYSLNGKSYSYQFFIDNDGNR
ncbi:putative T6SS immunity periplasmic lipoprotein [Enterobacter sp. P82]|uniref:putative T6SS immunity periplasmic lipoprotein n=1 Tax=Enterobacter sp. P82 TaxID=3123033 RepID=UPI00300CD014